MSEEKEKNQKENEADEGKAGREMERGRVELERSGFEEEASEKGMQSVVYKRLGRKVEKGLPETFQT